MNDFFATGAQADGVQQPETPNNGDDFDEEIIFEKRGIF
jgi:hypothetical protein